MSTRSEWIHSQGVDFGSKAGGEVWIFVFHNHKQTNKKRPLQYCSTHTCNHQNLWMYWWGFTIHHSNFDMDDKKSNQYGCKSLSIHARGGWLPGHGARSRVVVLSDDNVPIVLGNADNSPTCLQVSHFSYLYHSQTHCGRICSIKNAVGENEWVQFWLNLILYQDSSGIVCQYYYCATL